MLSGCRPGSWPGPQHVGLLIRPSGRQAVVRQHHHERVGSDRCQVALVHQVALPRSRRTRTMSGMPTFSIGMTPVTIL
jgi:hypothetical protein